MSKLFLTTIPEGTAVMTMLWGKSKPRFILAYHGHHLNRNNNVVKTEGWADNDPRWESMGIQIPSPADEVFIKSGLYPIGFWPRQVVTWDQTWSEWTHLDENGKTIEGRRLWVRKEPTSQFMVKNFPYAFRMKEVETSLGIKVDLDFTVYVEGTNPETALVHNDDWYLRFEGEIRKRVRNYIGAKDLFDLMSDEQAAKPLLALMHPLQAIKERKMAEAAAGGKPLPVIQNLPAFDEYVATTTVLAGGQQVSLPDVLGIKVTDASMESFGLSASEAELLKLMSSTTQQDILNQNIRTEADAKKDAAVKAGEGEAKAMDLVTAARVKRWAEVDEKIAASSGGVAIATVEAQTAAAVKIAGLQSDAMGKVAAAVAGNQKLTTVVFPNAAAAPVVPIGEKVA